MKLLRQKLIADFKILIDDAEELIKATVDQAGEQPSYVNVLSNLSKREKPHWLSAKKNCARSRTGEKPCN